VASHILVSRNEAFARHNILTRAAAVNLRFLAENLPQLVHLAEREAEIRRALTAILRVVLQKAVYDRQQLIFRLARRVERRLDVIDGPQLSQRGFELVGPKQPEQALRRTHELVRIRLLARSTLRRRLEHHVSVAFEEHQRKRHS
jgi:hypothetical protein